MKWFNDLKMIRKLVSAFVIVALFIGIVGFVGMYSMKNINKNIIHIYKVDLIGVDTINKIKANLLKINTDLLLELAPKNKGDLQKNKDDIASLKAKDDELIVKYKTIITTDLNRQQFAEFEKLLVDYRKARDPLIQQVEEGNYDKTYELFPAISKITTNMLTVLEDRKSVV